MNKKKPAQSSDELLLHRPRKGDARSQSESEAKNETISHHVISKPPRRRGRRSQNTVQINMKLSPEITEKFTALADEKNLIFCDTLAMLLDVYEKNKDR